MRAEADHPGVLKKQHVLDLAVELKEANVVHNMSNTLSKKKGVAVGRSEPGLPSLHGRPVRQFLDNLHIGELGDNLQDLTSKAKQADPLEHQLGFPER
eukprot:symbB.v1.2.013079.t1/scaffold920.1/size152120/1